MKLKVKVGDYVKATFTWPREEVYILHIERITDDMWMGEGLVIDSGNPPKKQRDWMVNSDCYHEATGCTKHEFEFWVNQLPQK